MKNAFKHSFDTGFERTVIIGTDSPTLPLSYIRNAFDVLKEIPVTVGPTFDGGYYLIETFRTGMMTVFDDIEWSTSRVFSQTLARIKMANKQLYILPPWYDVDTPDSLEFLRSHLLSMKMSGNADIPENTLQFLKI